MRFRGRLQTPLVGIPAGRSSSLPCRDAYWGTAAARGSDAGAANWRGAGWFRVFFHSVPARPIFDRVGIYAGVIV